VCRIIAGRNAEPTEVEARNAGVAVDACGRGVAMTEHAVVIAGGGPTGMMSGTELALAKVDVVIVERRTSQDLDGSRAGVFTPARWFSISVANGGEETI
jgi:ribulose 1,5-bisphosphate synthetase/thiazole synthase